MKRYILPFLFSSSLCAADYNLIVDRYFSPYIGAEDLISVHQGLEEVEDSIYRRPQYPSRKFWPVIERFSELFFAWDPVNSLAIVTQHEVFGHGFRVRTLHSEGARVRKYQISGAFPYNEGGGATHFTLRDGSTTTFEKLAIDSGGVEATALLANRLKLHWLQKGTIDARESSLYLGSEQDLSGYAWLSGENDNGDISKYVHLLNKTYPRGHLTVKSIKKQSFLNLLDPFTYYSLYAWFNYVFTGQKTPIPMIPFGSYQYLPGFRLGLTPFGPEYYFENFLVKNRRPIYFYFRGGKFAHQTYLGFGFEHDSLWTFDSMPWGFRFDCWYQPHTAFRNLRYSLKQLHHQGHFHSQPHHPHYGMALSLIGHLKLWARGSFYFQLGGKSVGFLPGEPLQQSLIARIGFTVW